MCGRRAYARRFLAGSFNFWEYLQQEKTKCGSFCQINILRAVLQLGASEFLSQCTVPEFFPWGVGEFWPISGKLP